MDRVAALDGPSVTLGCGATRDWYRSDEQCREGSDEESEDEHFLNECGGWVAKLNVERGALNVEWQKVSRLSEQVHYT